jgi:hypothetical protein
MDVVKGAKDIAKELTGLNDFKKAKDAFDRAGATAKGVDGDISDAVGALPSYTKDIAVGVGNAAIGAGKAVINFLPVGRAQKAADVVSKTALNAFKPKAYAPATKTPKAYAPPVRTPGRQFAPKPGGVKAPTRPRNSDDALPSKPTDKSTGGYPVNPKPSTAPKASPKNDSKAPATTPKKTGLGRAGAFTAGALLAGDDKPKTGNWTASAVV